MAFCLLGGLILGAWAFWLGLFFASFCLFFFRDPERVPPARPGVLLAPADGRVVSVGPAVPPEVRVVAAASDQSTVIEVRAHDLPGLLYTVSSALTAAGVSVVSARVDTLGADAVDVFYVQTPDGAPLSGSRAREVAEGCLEKDEELQDVSLGEKDFIVPEEPPEQEHFKCQLISTTRSMKKKKQQFQAE